MAYKVMERGIEQERERREQERERESKKERERAPKNKEGETCIERKSLSKKEI